MPVTSPEPPVLLTSCLSIRGSYISFIRFDYLLEWLTKLRTILYLCLRVYYKVYNSGEVKQKSFTGQGVGAGYMLPPCPLRVCHPPSSAMCSLIWKLPELHCWSVYRAQSPTLPCLPSSEYSGLEWKFQPSNHLTFLVTNPS